MREKRLNATSAVQIVFVEIIYQLYRVAKGGPFHLLGTQGQVPVKGRLSKWKRSI